MKDAIIQMLTMTDVLARYAPRKIVKGRCDCPLHGGDSCFQVYDKSFFCFSCGKGGDLIKFVAELFNIPYRSAMIRLDYDFSLGLSRKPSFFERQRIKAQTEKIKAEQRKREEMKIYTNEIYADFCDLFHAYTEDGEDTESLVILSTIISAIMPLKEINEEMTEPLEELLADLKIRKERSVIKW